MKDQCFNLSESADNMRENVKAGKRQNKLLGVALSKATDHQTNLENLSMQLENQRNIVNKQSVLMPNLVFSPFLPLEQ